MDVSAPRGATDPYAHMTPLMRDNAIASRKGKTANHCPWCATEQLDPTTGYCDHMVGICKGDRDEQPSATFERVVRIERNGKLIRRETRGEMIEKRLPTDVLKRITTDYRVYRQHEPA